MRAGLPVLALLLALVLAQPARAENALPPEIVQVANEAQVDPLDLLGAINTTGYAPRMYLCLTGELPCPRPPVPPISGAVARADCIIGKESGGVDKPNAQGSGALGPGQYMPGTWTTDVALYREATGYTGPLNLHSLADVRRVMAFILSAYPGKRTQWTVSGC